MASLNFYVQGNKHLHFKVLQIKINEKQTLLWVWRLYWKTGQGRNEYFLWFVKELHNECQVMWKAWHMVQARALRGSLFIQPLHSWAKSSQTTHMADAKMMMKNDFFISARYRLIRLLLTTDHSRNLSTNNLHFLLLGLSHSGWCIINSVLRALLVCLVFAAVSLFFTLFKRE